MFRVEAVCWGDCPPGEMKIPPPPSVAVLWAIRL
jgi:hypothetical protein